MARIETKTDQVRLAPFLKWAGGKRWFVSNHADVFPRQFNRYIEPFLGSGAVYFHLKPGKALLTDLNSELIETYKVIQGKWASLTEALARHQHNHSDSYFYKVRSQVPRNDVETAARFIYLNRTCWNGLYRVNRKGEFNVPRGTKNAVLTDADNFETVSQALKGASLRVCDFEPSVDAAKAGDLLFVDPPYTVKHNNNGFIKYNEKIFSWDDQVRLSEALARADERGVSIIMTNANHNSVRDLYKGFTRNSLSRHSVLSGVAEGRGATEELLVTNGK